MTTSNGVHKAEGTGQVEKVDKPGLTEDIDLDPVRGLICALRIHEGPHAGTWCSRDTGHAGACRSFDGPQFQPTKPPAGWHLLLPAPRTWCRKCARPVPIVSEQGPVDPKTNTRTTYYRVGPHNNCPDENTLASEHPKFRG